MGRASSPPITSQQMSSKRAHGSSHYSIFIFHLPFTIPPFKVAKRLLFAKDYLCEKMEKSFAAVVWSVFDLFLGRKTLQFSKTPVLRYFKAYRYQTPTDKVYDFHLPSSKIKQVIDKIATLHTLCRQPCDPIAYNLFPINPAGFTSTYCISSLFRKSDLPQGILLDV